MNSFCARPRRSAGYRSANTRATDWSSARARSRPTSGRTRATTVLLYIPPKFWRSNVENAIGTYSAAGSPFDSAPRNGNSNRSGMTPTTVYGSRSSVIVRPTIDGSRPNARDHKPALSTATFRLCRSSSSVKARPNDGATPSTEKSAGDTRAAWTRSGCAMPDSSYVALR